MQVEHIITGRTVNVPVGKSKRLVATGSWRFVTTADTVKDQLDIQDPSTAEVAREQLELPALGEDTPEEVQEPTEASEPQEEASKPAATIEEMRKWAQENGVEGIKDKGKLPRRAVDAYHEAHKD
jgi:hypothetical protein